MPLTEEKKKAWNFVRGIYTAPVISEPLKKKAWDRVHRAYGGAPIIKDGKTLSLMSEAIPEREVDMGVKEVKAKETPEEPKRKALYSLGQWAWRRFGGNEIKPVNFSVSSGVAHFYIKNVDKVFTGYWPEWAPILSTPIRYAGGQVMIRRDGTIGVSVPLKRLEDIDSGDTTEQKAYNWFERAFGWSIMEKNGNITLEPSK